MKIKKIIALLLALVMCLSMAACGGKKGKTEPAEDPGTQEEVPAETEVQAPSEEPESETPAEEEVPVEDEDADAEAGTEEGPVSYEVIMYGHALENVNIRKAPTKEADKLDKVNAGSIVEIYEVRDNIEGYTWYRIGEDMWVANDGTWFELCDSEIYVEGYFGVKPWDMTEEERQAWLLDEVKKEAKITESRADSTFKWVVTPAVPPVEHPNEDYLVKYEGEWFGTVYETSCWIDRTSGEPTFTDTYDNRNTYDPEVNYDPANATVIDPPASQTVFEGDKAEVLEAVKAHCDWYEDWYKSLFPNGITQSYGCDWVIDAQDEGVWTGYLYVYGETSASDVYDFCVTLTDGVYNVEDTDGPYL